MRLLLCLLLSVWTSMVTSAQPDGGESKVPRGVLVERVVVASDTSQTYALYLPSGYTPDRTWPLLMAFDPVARGAVPVALFQDEAERLGWIVAGSNVSRNGPLNVSLDAARKMEADLIRRVHIDPKRVYTAGFSGGARVASLIADQLNGQVAGVIGAGAGFHQSVPVTHELHYAYFSTLGLDDYNFPELLDLERRFKETKVPYHFARFEGAHQWPPAEVAARSLRWMETQAMKEGLRPSDEMLLAQWFANDLNAARSHDAAGDFYMAYRRYHSAACDYDGLLDTSEANRRAESLKTRAAEAEAEEIDQAAQQMRMAKELFELGNQFLVPDLLFEARSELLRSIRALRREAKSDTPYGLVARRTLSMANAYFIEAATLHHTVDGELIIAYLRVASEINPGNPWVKYQLAMALARSGERRKAIKALEEAVEAGFGTTFGSASWLASEDAFASIRGEKAFEKLLRSMGERP